MAARPQCTGTGTHTGCGKTTPADSPTPRYKFYFEDDAVCYRSKQVAQRLLAAIKHSDSGTEGTESTNNKRLAMKALKYRNVYQRMTAADVAAAEFDASAFLGVEWCKTTSLDAHCHQLQIARIPPTL